MKRTIRLAVVLVLISAALAFAAEWWQEDQTTPVKSTVQVARTTGAPGQSAASMINWEDGYIEAIGMATVDNAKMKNVAQAELMAAEGARAMAYARLSEVLNGVAVSSETLVQNCLTTDQVVRTKTEAFIKGARIIEEKVDWVQGSPKGFCRLGLVLKGERGVQNVFVEWTLRADQEKYLPLFDVKPYKMIEQDDLYSGLVIDARGLGIQPAMAPQVMTDKGELFYGARVVDPAVATQQGVGGYASELNSPAVTQRVGNKPLVIKAKGAYGKQKAGVQISTEDAIKAITTFGEGLLKLGKILLLI